MTIPHLYPQVVWEKCRLHMELKPFPPLPQCLCPLIPCQEWGWQNWHQRWLWVLCQRIHPWPSHYHSGWDVISTPTKSAAIIIFFLILANLIGQNKTHHFCFNLHFLITKVSLTTSPKSVVGFPVMSSFGLWMVKVTCQSSHNCLLPRADTGRICTCHHRASGGPWYYLNLPFFILRDALWLREGLKRPGDPGEEHCLVKLLVGCQV